MKFPTDMSHKRVHGLAGNLRGCLYSRTVDAKGFLDELKRIALTALTDAEDLRGENDVRCAGCNRYGVVGHACEHCGQGVVR